MKNKGFTLIELLVVIAIIGILSAIVLASLSSAKNKGGTAAIQATMKQFAVQAALYRSGNPSFGASATCSTGVFSDPVIQSQEAEILANAASGATLSCYTDSAGNTYAMSVSPLRTGGSWCIDNSAHFSTTTAQLISGTAICQ